MWHQVADAQDIADALTKDYKSKLEIPYVSAAIAQLHVFSSATASAAGSSPDQLLAAVTSNPKDHSARIALAGLMFASGDKQGAIEHLLQSIKLDRSCAVVITNRKPRVTRALVGLGKAARRRKVCSRCARAGAASATLVVALIVNVCFRCSKRWALTPSSRKLEDV